MTSVLASPLQVRKRNGTLVDYRKEKINQVVRLCLVNGCAKPDNEVTAGIATTVSDNVDRIIRTMAGPVNVETIQDLVVLRLRLIDADAADHFTHYREEHRKLRKEFVVDPDVKAMFDDSRKYFTGVNRHAQMIQAFDKFARYRRDDGRREVWPESVRRATQYTVDHCKKIGIFDKIGGQTFEDLEKGLLWQEASPSMRLIQMAGPALERCQSGVYNCAFQFMDGPQALAEELYVLMQGCGAGFSVENRYAASKWPRVKHQKANAAVLNHVIPDTTEGWCDAIKLGAEVWFGGHDIKYDFSQIRPEGTPLKTKGGRASGPGPLKDLLNFTRNKILGRQGDVLTTLDIHDVTCFAHRIVQMGGVRRASGISLSDLKDSLMRNCKSGVFYHTDPQRNQANNSAVYEAKPDSETFMVEWLSLIQGKSGERGIMNRGGLKTQLPSRRLNSGNHVYGTNPCGEIILRSKQFCNLSIAVARTETSVPELKRRIRMATLWGTIQATMTNFNYLSAEWRKNCEEERLLGVDILGHMDSRLLRPVGGSLCESDRQALLRELRDDAVQYNAELSKQFGINQSTAVTCGKPSGDSSVFFDAAAGFKAHHGKFWIRRLRLSSTNPIANLLKDSGVPWEADYDKSNLLVFEVPCEAPDDQPIVLGDQSALDQLENWKAFKTNFTEHNPSVTIYVKNSEWFAVGNWVYENWDIVGGLSFFPYDDSVYRQAPYEAINETEYRQRRDVFPDIDWSKLARYETKDMTDLQQQVACTGDRCSL